MTRPVPAPIFPNRVPGQTQGPAQSTEGNRPQLREDAEAPRENGGGIKRARSAQDDLSDNALPDNFSEPQYKKQRTQDDAPNAQARPASIHAALLGHDPEAVQGLLAAPEMDFAARNRDKLTPLMCAVRSGSLPLMQQVWQAMPESEDMRALRSEAFLQAVKSARTDMVSDMLQRQPDLAQVCYAGGRTALHFAVVAGNAPEANLLLAAGADVSAKDSDGNTPLLLMAKFDQSAVYAALREYGASSKDLNHATRSAASEAILSGSYGALALLAADGAEMAFSTQDMAPILQDSLARSLIEQRGLRPAALEQRSGEAVDTGPLSSVADFDQFAELQLSVVQFDEKLLGEAPGYSALCAAVSRQEVKPLPAAQGKQLPTQPAVSKTVKLQRRMALAELQIVTKFMPLHLEKIIKSRLPESTKTWLLKTHSATAEVVGKIKSEALAELCSELVAKLRTPLILNCIDGDNILLESRLYSRFTRDCGLFPPVAALLVGGIAAVLAKKASPGTGPVGMTWGEHMASNGERCRRSLQDLPALLKVWGEEISQRKTSDCSGPQENLDSAEESPQEPPHDDAKRPRLPPAFFSALQKGLMSLSTEEYVVRDAYVNLIFDQWHAVQSALVEFGFGKSEDAPRTAGAHSTGTGDGLELDI